MSKVFGIDISTWQRGYPYAKAKKEGVKFAILRAGYSFSKDNQFDTHYKNAKAIGWGVGAYWYTYAESVAEAKKEVAKFLSVIKGKTFEYPIYLDIEDRSIRKLSRSTLNEIVKVYGEAIEKAGYYFGVYSNYDWYKNVISGSTLNKRYDWWVASWTKTMPTGVNAGMWQFGGSSNALRSPKVAGVVTDQDYAFKDYPSIMKSKGLNGFKKQSGTTPSVKPSKPSTPSKPNNTIKVYIVKRGDTLIKIASKYHTTYQKLAKDNNIKNPNLIYVGQKIKIK